MAVAVTERRERWQVEESKFEASKLEQKMREVIDRRVAMVHSFSSLVHLAEFCAVLKSPVKNLTVTELTSEEKMKNRENLKEKKKSKRVKLKIEFQIEMKIFHFFQEH